MEEKKIREIFGEAFDSLTDRQKEQVRSLGSEKDAAEFAAKEGIELKDEVLNEVSAGIAKKTYNPKDHRIPQDKGIE